MMKSFSRRRLWIAVAILLAIVVWLALHWPHTSFWYDEALTTWVALDSWESLWRWCTQVDIQVPFHYVVLRLWSGMAGSSEFSLRAVSVLSVPLAAAGIMAAGRLATRRPLVGYAAALLLATLPGMMWLGFEVRAYALGMALLAWATALLLWLANPASSAHFSPRPAGEGLGVRAVLPRRDLPLLIGYSLIMLAALYTHYFAIGGFIAHALILALAAWRNRSRQLLTRLISICLLVGIGFAPWLPIMLTRGAADRSFYPGGPILPDRLLTVGGAFKLFGFDTAPTWTLPYVIGYGDVMLLGLILTLLPFPRRTAQSADRRFGAIAAFLIAFIPMVLAAVLVYFKPKLAGRYIWPSWIGIDLLLGLAVLAVSRWWRVLGIVALAALLVIPWARGERGHPPDSDFRAAYAYLCQNGDPRDVVILRDGTLFVVHRYYSTRPPCTERRNVPLPETEITNVELTLTYPTAQAALEKVLAMDAPNIWVVSWQGDVTEPQGLIYGLLEYTGDHPVIGRMYGDVRLDRYVPHQKTLPDPFTVGEAVNKTPVETGPMLHNMQLFAPSTLHTGDVITVQTWWTRGTASHPDLRASARLMTLDGGWMYTQLDQPPASWKYYDDRWKPGEPVLGRYELTVGPDVPPGKQVVRLIIYDSYGRWPQVVLTVGEVTVVR